MKKSFLVLSHYLFLVMLIFNVGTIKSVPANPNPIKVCQPNGDTISVRLKGDEYSHQVETEDGYTLVESGNNTLEYATQDAQGNLVSSHVMAKNKANRTDNERKTLSRISQHLQASPQQKSPRLKSSHAPLQAKVKSSSNAVTGKKKLLCILIGFTDKPFVKTKAEFENLFNKPGYNVNGGTGSVRDFYLEASYNQLELNTTVVGPYTASKDRAYYGSNSNQLIQEACQLADPTVNFADYDNDGDGWVDQVIVIHGGYSGETSGIANDIWSYRGGLNQVLSLDGKSLVSFCTVSELDKPNNGSNIAVIGPVCHEFGHCLGAWDYYDTNGDTDGNYRGTGWYDLMSIGVWANGAKTPAHPNAYVKTSVFGWSNAKTIKTGQSLQILNSTQNTNQYYRINAFTPGEYYLLENKQQLGFDRYVTDHGMLVYHVDSTYISVAGNCINCTNHQGMYIVPSGSKEFNGVETSANSSYCPFPSAYNITSFTDNTTPNMKSWASDNTYAPLTNITENPVTKIINLDFKGGVPGVAPSTQATNLTVSNLSYGSLTLNWKRGNGDGVIILARESTPISTPPSDGVHYLSNPKFGTTSCQLGGAYVVYTGVGTSVDISGLKMGTTYYFSAYEYKGVSVAYKSPSLDANASTLGGSVCNIAANHNTMTYCSKVAFNTISQVSEIVPGVYNNYLDYTNSRTNVVQGSTYPLSVTLTILMKPTGLVYSKAWIDWNRNGSFDDTGETYDLGSVYTNFNTPPLTVNVAIPSNAALGFARMRVTCKETSNFGSCDGGAITGEMQVQDYMLNVVSGTPTTVSEGDEPILKIYPNPVSEVLRIEGISSFSNLNFQIFDIHGQLVKTGSINNSNSISVSDLSQGMYFLKLENGMLAKFIKH
jgi:M6 family metalloprotease-like protein